MQHANDNSAPANAWALTFASVCSGIEAASVAFNPIGWRAVCFSEIEKFPSAVLGHHYPDVPNLGDFTKIDTNALPRVDILCGGTPCQAFSVAGLRQSLDDARGNLSLEFVRLAHELADGNGLRNVVWENVPGVLSTKDNAFGCFLAGLVGADDALPPPTERSGKRRRWPNAGMVAGSKGRAAWRVLDAQYFGLAQRRKRVILVADFGNGADPAAVLFEPESVRRDSPPSRETGQGVAAAASKGTGGGGGLTPSSEVAPCLRARSNASHRLDTEAVVAFAPEIARCDTTREGSSQDYESTTMVAVGVTGPISHALKAEGADGSEDGTGRGTPIVCFSAKDYGADASIDLAPTLRAGGHTTSHANAGVMPAIAYALNSHAGCADGVATAELGGEVAAALRASSGGGDKPHVLTSAVRRLTPRECERLQGLPDDYTRIPWRNRPASDCPDGPRYKTLGNSWAVPLFTWLGKRIEKYMPHTAANDNNKDSTSAAA